MDTAERRLGIKISDELRLFYRHVGGADEPTPPEHGWMTFWPLARWEHAAKAEHGKHVADLVLLADYSLSSWWYATSSWGGVESPIFILDGLRSARLVAESFASFVDAVFADDPSIYPEPIPVGAG